MLVLKIAVSLNYFAALVVLMLRALYSSTRSGRNLEPRVSFTTYPI